MDVLLAVLCVKPCIHLIRLVTPFFNCRNLFDQLFIGESFAIRGDRGVRPAALWLCLLFATSCDGDLVHRSLWRRGKKRFDIEESLLRRDDFVYTKYLVMGNMTLYSPVFSQAFSCASLEICFLFCNITSLLLFWYRYSPPSLPSLPFFPPVVLFCGFSRGEGELNYKWADSTTVCWRHRQIDFSLRYIEEKNLSLLFIDISMCLSVGVLAIYSSTSDVGRKELSMLEARSGLCFSGSNF